MKKLRQIINEIKTLLPGPSAELDLMLAQYLFYPPKIPLRLAQEQLLKEAETGTLKVYDEFFSGAQLTVNAFNWGSGKRKVFLTHGWGSKAADFSEIISALITFDDIEVVSFDAPANGSSEGQLSNLLLYILSFKAAVQKYGNPDIVIGHSLGVMANVAALAELNISPQLLISVTPLVRLKENFEASMDAVGVDRDDQHRVLTNFAVQFRKEASYFTLGRYYELAEAPNHWLFYDSGDLVSPFTYLEEFLDRHPEIHAKNYEGAGHERILKSADMIADLIALVNAV